MTTKQLLIENENAPYFTVTDKNSGHQQVHIGWQLSKHYADIHLIQLEHVLQYLTTMEADTMLLDVFNTLAVGGRIDVVTDDVDAVFIQWQQAVWSEENIRDPDSDARQSFSRLFGPQQTGNPTQPKYSQRYPDTYKSAYNCDRMQFLLERAGFIDVIVTSSYGKLLAHGTKSMQRGERQISRSLAGIRPDHINRYDFAARILAEGSQTRVLDLACGVGYGSALLAKRLGCQVTGVDIDNGAINFARQHYAVDGTEFIQADARAVEFEPESYDAIVSFETIEHITFDAELLQTFYRALKPGGILIVSTPNQDVMAFDAEIFQYHIRHYTVPEFKELIMLAGLEIHAYYQQKDPHGGVVEPGDKGAFTILVCRKA